MFLNLANDSLPKAKYVREIQKEYIDVWNIIKNEILDAMYSTKTECNIKLDYISNIPLEKIEKELNALGYKTSICIYKGCTFITVNWKQTEK